MNRRILSYIFLITVVGANIYYLPLTIQIIESGGGPFEFGALVLPFTACINLLLITTFLSIFKCRNNILTTINSIGVVGIALLSYLIYTSPEPRPSNERSFIVTSNGVTDTITVESLLIEDSITTSKQELEETNTQEEQTEDDCIFNNDVKGLSTEAILSLDSTLAYIWDGENQEVLTIYEGDTVFVSFGGCYHMNFVAGIRTTKRTFEDTVFWFGKAKWLADSFFRPYIGEDYSRAIENNQLIKRENNTINEFHYYLPVDTGITNIIHEGITISRTETGTTVEIGSYMN